MSEPNYSPDWAETMPIAKQLARRCPPCTGNCAQGDDCDADPNVDAERGAFRIMSRLLLVVVLGCLAMALRCWGASA